jgi:predicted MPP superfamily phosphohydrolase
VRFRPTFRQWFWGLVLLGGLWSFGIEPGLLQERRLELASANWHAKPITIGFASDFHVGAPHAGPAQLRRVVDGLMAAQPDLILLGGDFVIQGVLGGEKTSPEAIAAELARLHAPLGVHAVLGNHDWWLDGGQVSKALTDAGIQVHENERVTLADGIQLAGVGDDMTNHANVAQTFRQGGEVSNLIVLLHDPANAPELPAGAAVALTGHTHGGQVRLPFIGALITPGRSPLRHAWGWIPDVPVPTWVSAGVGTSILPVRFNCPPEYVLLHLHGTEKS